MASFAVLAPLTEIPDWVVESYSSLVFAAAAFLFVWAGATQFNRKIRDSGAFLLLVAGLLFFPHLWLALDPLRATSQKSSHFWPLLMGGVAAVIYLHVRLSAEDTKRSAAESKRIH